MATWFGSPFDRVAMRDALVEAMRRRGVEHVHVGLDRSGGLVARTTRPGRDKAAARARSADYGGFLRVLDTLRCDRHEPSTYRRCRACLCGFNGDGVYQRSPLGPETATAESCEIAGSGKHDWMPAGCVGSFCNGPHSTDLDDLRAALRAGQPIPTRSDA